MALMSKRQLLAQVPLFAELADTQLDQVSEICTTTRHPPKEVIFYEGQEASETYVVARGEVRVTIAGISGREAILRTMRRGDVLGQIAMMDGRPRSATATAVDDLELLVFRRRDLLHLMQRNPEIAIKLLKGMASLVRDITDQLADRTFLPIPARLAKWLVRRSGDSGTSTHLGISIDLKMTHEEVGMEIGCTRESVTNTLLAWRTAGIVDYKEQLPITILDLSRMEQVAALELSAPWT